MKERCPWVNVKNQLYVDYHDKEWGVPVHDDRMLFEMLVLEGAQAGLSWETVLKRRDSYRAAFASFDPVKVSKFGRKDVARLMKDEGVIRHRLKIEGAITNARCFLEVQREFGSFSKYLWNFVGGAPLVTPRGDLKSYPTHSQESDALSKDLKKRGFTFVGTTICYAYMQAVGLVNDHARCCFRSI